MRVRVPPPAPFLNVKPVCMDGFFIWFDFVGGLVWGGLWVGECEGYFCFYSSRARDACVCVLAEQGWPILALAICAGVSGGRRWARPALLLGRFGTRRILIQSAFLASLAGSGSGGRSVRTQFDRIDLVIGPNPPAHRHRPLNVSGRAWVFVGPRYSWLF